MTMSDTCVIQVTNIAPSVSNEQMKTLFSNLGTIKEIAVYPNEDSALSPTSRVCYIRYADHWSVGVSQHLTNTVFVDRALIVLPVDDGKIPDATTALNLTSGGPLAGGSNSGVVSQVITGVGGAQVITTIDPRLTALGLPQYPPLPANMDPTKIEEIRRTVYIGNLDSTLSAEQLLTFFNQIGEVKYIRMAGDETQPTRFAFVEFTDQSSVANALQYNGVIFGGRPLKINHSNNSIVKPQAKSSEVAQKEIEEAMKRVREAQSLISAAIEPGFSMKFDKILEYTGKEKSKSRSRSRSRRRSTSRSKRRSRSRTRRSRSKERRRRSRSHSTDKRTRDRRSRSHERRRSRTRSRSRDRRHRRRSRSRERDERRSRRRSRSRDREKSKRRHSRSRSRSKRSDDPKAKEIEKLKEKVVSDSTEVESKPEGPELPPEEVKSENTELEVISQSTPSEIAKSPRKSVSLSPPRRYSTRRSRSPKRRSRSKDRKRSRTPTKSHKKKRDRDREKDRDRDKDRDRERDRDRDRDKERSHSRERKDRKKRRKDRDDSSERPNRETKVKRDYDEEEKGYDSKEEEKTCRRSSGERSRRMSLSPD